MFNKHDLYKNRFMLDGSFAKRGYDWWWHSFTARNEKTNEEKPFYIEFFIVNPKLNPHQIVYGNNKEKPSYLMVNCGCWKDEGKQLHRFFKLDDVQINKYPYEIIADDCYASDNCLKGSINASTSDYMSDEGNMEWNLSIDKKIAFNVGYGTSKLFTFLKAFQMYWHAEGMKSLFEGYIIYNGEKYIVDKDSSYGYSDKNWGRGFTSPWVWLSSNNIVSNITHQKLENTVFDIGGGRPKIYFLPLNRKLLGALYLEGKEYEFNFSKFWKPTKTKFNSIETDDKIIWDVTQQCHGYVMETHIECYKKDMLLIRYEDPDGLKKHNKLWNGGNGQGTFKLYKKHGKNLEVIEDCNCYNVGCEYGEFDK